MGFKHDRDSDIYEGTEMSCDLWRWTEECDHRPCPGDCDLCEENTEDEEDED